VEQSEAIAARNQQLPGRTVEDVKETTIECEKSYRKVRAGSFLEECLRKFVGTAFKVTVYLLDPVKNISVHNRERFMVVSISALTH